MRVFETLFHDQLSEVATGLVSLLVSSHNEPRWYQYIKKKGKNLNTFAQSTRLPNLFVGRARYLTLPSGETTTDSAPAPALERTRPPLLRYSSSLDRGSGMPSRRGFRFGYWTRGLAVPALIQKLCSRFALCIEVKHHLVMYREFKKPHILSGDRWMRLPFIGS